MNASDSDLLDPDLESLLKDSLAVPMDSTERVLDRVTLRLRAQSLPVRIVEQPSWKSRLIAAGLLLVVGAGVFSLARMSRPLRETAKTVATSNDSEKSRIRSEDAPPETPVPPVAPQPVPPVDASKTDLEAAMAQLDAEDFENRDAAKRKLLAMGDPARKALKACIAKLNADPKSNAAQVAGIQAMLREFDLLEVGAFINKQQRRYKAAADEAVENQKSFEQDSVKKLRGLETLQETLQRRLEKETLDQDARAELTEQVEASLRKQMLAKEEYETRMRAFRKLNNRLQSYVCQLNRYQQQSDLGRDAILPMLEADDWDPGLLPFEHQLKAKVSFELIDTPLSEVCKVLRDVAGLDVQLLNGKAAGDANEIPINLRVTDMTADLAVDWIARLGELERDIDWKKKKVVLLKPVPGLPPAPAPAPLPAREESF